MLRQNVTLLVLCIRFQHPIFRVALYGGAHSSSRNSGHPNCCLASWGLKTLEYFHPQSQAKAFFRAFSRVSGFYSSCFFLLLHRSLSSFPEVFLGALFVPDDCHAVRMHPRFALRLFFLLPRPLPFAAALKSNSSVYRLNSWLHSSSVWAFDKKVLAKSIKVVWLNLFAVCSLGHEMQQGSCWVPRALLYWGLNAVYVAQRETFCCTPMFTSLTPLIPFVSMVFGILFVVLTALKYAFKYSTAIFLLLWIFQQFLLVVLSPRQVFLGWCSLYDLEILLQPIDYTEN